jgi:Protein kinase domain
MESYLPQDLLVIGPSAKIYRGIETHTQHPVRLKSFLSPADSCHAIKAERLNVVLQLMLALQHPNSCRVLGTDVDLDDVALITELSEGHDAGAALRCGELSGADIVVLAGQVMDALQAGHAIGLLHGNLKPSNLIIAGDHAHGFSLQVQDWALGLGRTKHPWETLRYASPEFDQVGPSVRGDLFSAAAIFMELVAGKTAALDHNGLPNFDINGHRRCRADLPESFCDWLAWLLQADARQRPSSAMEALTALRNGTAVVPEVRGNVPQARPLAAPLAREQPVAVGGRRWGMVAAAIVVNLGLVGGLLAGYIKMPWGGAVTKADPPTLKVVQGDAPVVTHLEAKSSTASSKVEPAQGLEPASPKVTEPAEQVMRALSVQ